MINHVLLIDDDKQFHASFKSVIESDEVKCFFAANSKQAIEILSKNDINLIFLDLDLGDEKGIDILPELTVFNTPICILSGTATVNITVKALKLGAMDVAEKPLTRDKILDYIKSYSKKIETTEYSSKWKSAKMKDCDHVIHQIAASSAKILLRGETGCGKEVIARKIHELSDRKNGPFVAVNCGAIPEHLIENELFGSEKGAFTGSDKQHLGMIREAENGTLFLDEIAELPLMMQVKILRFLQEDEIRPIGSDKTIKVNVRIIAATHKNLEEMVKDKSFREDLYFRLNVFTIDIPALRERVEDIDILLNDIIEHFKFKYRNDLQFTSEALDALKSYAWPGNIRELSNLIERLMLICFKPVSVMDLPKNLQSLEVKSDQFDKQTLKEARDAFEKEYILSVIDECSSLKEVSERLQVERTTLYKKMKSLDIEFSK